jgi:cellulose synthase/poly-beta-1,6-N-acetylglucosamine synthase-like glycosyltransferase/peptidoglycan/xylan/chitin deacetylase (PgdA/CDA1 family)/spore germination protein YaaH
MSVKKNQHQVFYDSKGRRKKRILVVWIVISVAIITLTANFINRVITLPAMPQLNFESVNSPLRPANSGSRLQNSQNNSAVQQEDMAAQTRGQPKPGVAPYQSPVPTEIAFWSYMPRFLPLQHDLAPKPLSIGFYVNWDSLSYLSLERHLAELDLLVPQWVRLQDGDEPVVREIDQKALDLIRSRKPNLPVIPMIHNSNEGKWDVPALLHAVRDEANRRNLISKLIQLIGNNKWQGICIDFEQVPKEAHPNLLLFMQELHALFQQRGWLVIEAVPFDDADWDYRAYGEASDYLMLMAYDEHWAESGPGSVCSHPWFQKTLRRRMSELAPEKTILCIGGFGYDWQQGKTSVMTFQDAMLAAAGSRAQIVFDRFELNPYFRYEKDGCRHEVWFLDAVTAYNQMLEARKYGVAGFALWRLGSEDPSLWSVFGSDGIYASPAGLQQIRPGYGVDISGEGELLRVLTGPKDGARRIEIDASSKFITTNQYQALPLSYMVQRTGQRPGLIALTFDDGPDPDWTPRILDILEREQVKATFFIVGQNGQSAPALVQRIVDEGHEIGNHSFTHPTLDEIHTGLTRVELNATRMLIESMTGRTTRLFRPPYFSAMPATPDKVEPVWIAEELGYITVASGVDPKDWLLPGAQAIVERTMAGITNPESKNRGQIVLLHDGGGDRSQTVEALPRLIRDLRSRGYRFSTISELSGLTRDEVMPPVRRGSSFTDLHARAVALSFYSISFAGWLLRWFFPIGIALGIARVIFIGSLAFAQWLRGRRREGATERGGEKERERGSEGESGGAGADDQPFVSVIVPAYNEEKVIGRTIDCLLGSTYPRLEIIVVDDGSSDRTGAVVAERFNGEPRVRLFNIPNCGKADALNYGLRYARGEVIVGLDADTFFERETIGRLTRHFADPRVGAVAGNVKVGNRNNLTTRLQALEYITSQNLDRRAFAGLNCITIVPGAVGACRRSLLDQCGGWLSDTMAEDQELTLSIRRLGYRIAYEEEAIAWTEAPETMRDLVKQRFRWSFGTLQCMWKHRDALFRPKYGALGFIAMPNVWIFQILFSLVSPVIDLMMIWAVISAALPQLGCTDGYRVEGLKHMVFYYGLFLGVELLTALFAFAMEKREQWSLLWWLCLQRFYHQQVIYYVMIKSVLAALSGALIGWRKLERKATVGVMKVDSG